MTHDPVCSMEVDEIEAMNQGLTDDMDGHIYYFCSEVCKEQFEMNPIKYINQKTGDWETESGATDDFGA